MFSVRSYPYVCLQHTPITMSVISRFHSETAITLILVRIMHHNWFFIFFPPSFLKSWKTFSWLSFSFWKWDSKQWEREAYVTFMLCSQSHLISWLVAKNCKIYLSEIQLNFFGFLISLYCTVLGFTFKPIEPFFPQN